MRASVSYTTSHLCTYTQRAVQRTIRARGREGRGERDREEGKEGKRGKDDGNVNAWQQTANVRYDRCVKGMFIWMHYYYTYGTCARQPVSEKFRTVHRRIEPQSLRRAGAANTVIVHPNENRQLDLTSARGPRPRGNRRPMSRHVVLKSGRNQRIRPYFSFIKCRSRSPESFGPVLAPKFAPRTPTCLFADKQTNRRGAREQPLSSHVAAHPAPTNTQDKEIDIPLWGNPLPLSLGHTSFYP